MLTARRRRFINGQIAWMLATITVLSTLRTLTLELFFVVSFVGFMLLTLATAPLELSPKWRSRLKWPLVLGFLIFLYLAIAEIISVLSAEVGWI